MFKMDVYLGVRNEIEIYLDSNKKDLENLETSGKLKAHLQDLWMGRLEKKVVLLFDKNQKMPLIIKYLPDRSDFDSCRTISITINEKTYECVKKNDFATSLKADCISISNREKTKFIKRFKKR